MGQATCEKCGRGYAKHSAKLCNEYIAQGQRDERMRVEGEQRDQRLITIAAQTAAGAASRKTAFTIFGGALLVVILLIAVLIGATGNAKEAGPSAAAGPTGAAPSAVAPRPGIVLRPRHP